jgi:hypothetical protein
MNNSPPLLIFEGAELVGKSYIISQIYKYLEPKYRQSRFRLDGCHWFNCDVGIFGGRHGRSLIIKYLEIAETIKDKPVIFEKFHLSDVVYNLLYQNKKISYNDVEKRLLKRSAKLILCTIREDEKIITRRLKDRVNLYSHYRAISKKPADYFKQQRTYQALVSRSILPTLTVDTSVLPNQAVTGKIINWIK